MFGNIIDRYFFLLTHIEIMFAQIKAVNFRKKIAIGCNFLKNSYIRNGKMRNGMPIPAKTFNSRLAAIMKKSGINIQLFLFFTACSAACTKIISTLVFPNKHGLLVNVDVNSICTLFKPKTVTPSIQMSKQTL